MKYNTLRIIRQLMEHELVVAEQHIDLLNEAVPGRAAAGDRRPGEGAESCKGPEIRDGMCAEGL